MCRDILQISKTWLATVHLMTLPKRSLLALNFVPSKSYFRHPKAVLHVYIFTHYPGMNLIDQSCTAQIFFIIKTTCRFQCCLCTMFIRPANQTRFHWWNVIISLVRSFEKSRCMRPEGPFFASL